MCDIIHKLIEKLPVAGVINLYKYVGQLINKQSVLDPHTVQFRPMRQLLHMHRPEIKTTKTNI